MKYSIRQSILARVVRLAWLPLCLVLVACHVDMYDQPKYKPNDVSNFFSRWARKCSRPAC
jgi:hypothetical protein